MSNIKPYVLMHILAKDKEPILEQWLKTNLEDMDYPHSSVWLYFRTNNNNDDTYRIIYSWVHDQEVYRDRAERDNNWNTYDKHNWANIEINNDDIDVPVQEYGIHEWNPTRFKALGALRQEGIDMAIELGMDFYYTVDVDNFTVPTTLSALVAHNQPVVAPLIRYALGKEEHKPYANYHNIASPTGYYEDNYAYYHILNGHVRGLIKCDVVHCSYLIRKDVLPKVTYVDGTDDYEYVIFSRNLREQNIPQYLDNTRIYGYLTLDEDLEACMKWMDTLQ